MTKSRDIEVYPGDYLLLLVGAANRFAPTFVPVETEKKAISLRHTLYCMRRALHIWIVKEEKNWLEDVKKIANTPHAIEEKKNFLFRRKQQYETIRTIAMRVKTNPVGIWGIEIYKPADTTDIDVGPLMKEMFSDGTVIMTPEMEEIASMFPQDTIPAAENKSTDSPVDG